MFIQEVMKVILKPISERYLKSKKQAEQMNAEELYKELDSSLEVFDTNDTNMHGTTIFVSPGCSHNVKDGMHCGCSFCDWNDSYLADPAKAKVLREKDHNLYKKLQYKSLEKLRGAGNMPKLMEEFALHDCFDDHQVSYDELNYIFNEREIYKKLPAIGLVQVRAESIDEEKIRCWKQFVRKQLTLGVGVETGHEWLRNHWLNKNLTDDTLEEAIKIAHESGVKVCVNLLIALPGLTDKQSVEVFVESMKKLYSMDCDSIMISPLVCKKYTLQNTIDNYIKEERKNNLDSVLIILEAISRLRDRKDILRKTMFSLLNFEDYFNDIEKKDEEVSKIVSDISIMLEIGAMKNYDELFERIDQIKISKVYREYKEKFEKQKGIELIDETLEDLGYKISHILFDEENSFKIKAEFDEELKEFRRMYE